MTDIVSTAIHIQQTPTRRRKSADETTSRTRHVDGLNGGGSAVYYLRHKSASRSLDDLNDITDTDDVVLVNGSPICAGELIGPKTVKSAAVIRLASTTSSEGGERDGYRLSLTKSITLNDTNNNSMITSSTPRDVMGEDNNTMQNKKKRRKLRNKSTSDVIDMNKKQDMSLEEAVSASVDNIFESGNRKNTESDNETLDGSTLTVSSKSSGIRPKKPKRSNASIKNFDYERARVVIPPLLHIGDSEISKYHRELNTSLDEHNNLSISRRSTSTTTCPYPRRTLTLSYRARRPNTAAASCAAPRLVAYPRMTCRSISAACNRGLVIRQTCRLPRNHLLISSIPLRNRLQSIIVRSRN